MVDFPKNSSQILARLIQATTPCFWASCFSAVNTTCIRWCCSGCRSCSGLRCWHGRVALGLAIDCAIISAFHQSITLLPVHCIVGVPRNSHHTTARLVQATTLSFWASCIFANLCVDTTCIRWCCSGLRSRSGLRCCLLASLSNRAPSFEPAIRGFGNLRDCSFVNPTPCQRFTTIQGQYCNEITSNFVTFCKTLVRVGCFHLGGMPR